MPNERNDRCTDELHFRLSVGIMSVGIMSGGIMSGGIIVVDRIQGETSPFLSDGRPVPAHEPHVPRSAVPNKKPVTHRIASHRFALLHEEILNMRSAGLRFTKLRIGVVQKSRRLAGHGWGLEQRPAGRRRSAGQDSESSGAARQKNRSSKAAKLARETMPMETRNSLASIGT
jgi:hypothetical protein